MRRAAAGASTPLAVLLLLAGCTLPDGVDGDLTGGWAPMPEPSAWTPAAGTCHTHEYLESVSLSEYSPASCDETHTLQTVYVGEFAQDAAERGSPPAPGTPVWHAAFAQCEEGAAAYLGAHHMHGPLRLQVVVPSEQAWRGGARWVRCDVSDENDRRGLEQSLVDALQPGSELVFECFQAVIGDDGRTVEDHDEIACAEPHNSEFVGVYHAPGSLQWPGGTDQRQPYFDGCREVAADFTDAPLRIVNERLRMIIEWQDEADWDEQGGQRVRCYLVLPPGIDVTGSLEGVGQSGLPEP